MAYTEIFCISPRQASFNPFSAGTVGPRAERVKIFKMVSMVYHKLCQRRNE